MSRQFGIPKPVFGRAVRTTNPQASGAQPPAGPRIAPTIRHGNVIQLGAVRSGYATRSLGTRGEKDQASILPPSLPLSSSKLVQALKDALTVAFWVALCGLLGLAIAGSLLGIGYLIFFGW